MEILLKPLGTENMNTLEEKAKVLHEKQRSELDKLSPENRHIVAILTTRIALSLLGLPVFMRRMILRHLQEAVDLDKPPEN